MFSSNLIKKAFFPIEKKEYNKILLLLFLTLLTSIMEILSVGIIIPILNFFVGNDYLKYSTYFQFFKLEDKNDFLILTLSLFFLAHVIKFFFNRYLIILQNSFTHDLYVKIAKILFQDYLNKDYNFHINKNSAELIRNVITEGNLFSFGVIFNLVRLISEFIIFTSLAILLIYINYKVSIIIISFFSISSFIFYKIHSSTLKKLGEKRQFHSTIVLKQLQESFNGFRELILNKLQPIFFKNFSIHTRENANIGIKKDIIVQMPRLILELITISSLILIVIFLIYDGYLIEEIFIILGIFLYTTMRILPSVSKIVQSINSIRYNLPVVDLIYNQIKNIKINQRSDEKNKNSEKFEFKEISLKNIEFYFKENNFIFKNLSLDVKNGSKIGLIGKSGSGKSTLINLLCGLLKPSSGDIEIDKQNISENIKNFQGEIGYVPQNVTIFDESIIFNIALEFDVSKIDFKKIDEILKELDLYDDFIKLPNKLNEKVGERGSKLSGGQCQRLGIARVLYNKPSIIFLDEATSALDSVVENKILSSLFHNYKECTFVVSTHRKKPLEYCDIVYEINDKKLKKINNE